MKFKIDRPDMPDILIDGPCGMAGTMGEMHFLRDRLIDICYPYKNETDEDYVSFSLTTKAEHDARQAAADLVREERILRNAEEIRVARAKRGFV